MLERLFEWYRAVHAEPNDEVLGYRKATVERLVTLIDGEEDYGLLRSLVVIAASGPAGRYSQDSRPVNELITAIREYHKAFPKDIEENGLELRVCAALTVGQLLDRPLESTEMESIAGFTGAHVVSAVAFRPLPPEKYLSQIMTELLERAHRSLEDLATEARERQSVDEELLLQLGQAPDPNSLASQVKQLAEAVNLLADNATADREELNILWWIYSGRSGVADAALRDLQPGAAAICSGGELGDLTSVAPAPDNIRHLARQAVERARDPESLKPVQLSSLVSEWTDVMIDVLADPEYDGSLDEYAVLTPLSWLCRRLKDSGLSHGWETEFEQKTGWSAAAEWGPGDLAVQVFNEQIAHTYD